MVFEEIAYTTVGLLLALVVAVELNLFEKWKKTQSFLSFYLKHFQKLVRNFLTFLSLFTASITTSAFFSHQLAGKTVPFFGAEIHFGTTLYIYGCIKANRDAMIAFIGALLLSYVVTSLPRIGKKFRKIITRKEPLASQTSVMSIVPAEGNSQTFSAPARVTQIYAPAYYSEVTSTGLDPCFLTAS